MPRLGQMSFQSNDSKDVFHVCDVIEPGIEAPDEIIMRINDFPYDGFEAWVTGKVPAIKTVYVEGDTAIINAWFRGEYFENKFFITVYVEYECAEEWVGIEPEREEKCEPKDIIL